MSAPTLPFDTASAAHARIASGKQETYTRILRAYRERGCFGFTADEAAVRFNCTHNHVAPRISELLKQGLLRETGRRRPTRTASLAAVLVHFEFGDSEDVTVSSAERERQRRRHG